MFNARARELVHFVQTARLTSKRAVCRVSTQNRIFTPP
jgi:hypothetical protein